MNFCEQIYSLRSPIMAVMVSPIMVVIHSPSTHQPSAPQARAGSHSRRALLVCVYSPPFSPCSSFSSLSFCMCVRIQIEKKYKTGHRVYNPVNLHPTGGEKCYCHGRGARE